MPGEWVMIVGRTRGNQIELKFFTPEGKPFPKPKTPKNWNRRDRSTIRRPHEIAAK